MRENPDKIAESRTLKDKLMAIVLIETAKDYKEMDSALVSECVDFLMELEGKERLTKEEIKQRVDNIPFKREITALNANAKKKISAKRIAVIAAVLAVIVALFGIFAVSSGDTVTEFFRKVGDSIGNFLDDSPKEYDGITFYKNDKAIRYSSLEDFKQSEELDVLYPVWLPEDEKIVGIDYIASGGTQRYELCSAKPEIGITIEIDAELAEDFKLNWTKKEVAGFAVYYMVTPELAQGNFVCDNNLYYVSAGNEDDLFKIIENLKGIN